MTWIQAFESVGEGGATVQRISVIPGNRKGIEFYEKHGFEYREERDAYGSESRTSLRYRREL